MSSSQKRKLDDISNAEPNDLVAEPIFKKRKLIENTNQSDTQQPSIETQSNNSQTNTILPMSLTNKESNNDQIAKSKIENINSNQSNQNTINTLTESTECKNENPKHCNKNEINNIINYIINNSIQYHSNTQTTNKINKLNQNEDDNSIQIENTKPNTTTNQLTQQTNDNQQNAMTNINDNSMEPKLNTAPITEDIKNEISETKQNDKEEMDEDETIQPPTDNTSIDPYKQYNWKEAKIILRATSIFADNNNYYKYLDGGNFIKSIDWSPNGLYLLSNSNDRKLRIFNPFNHMYENENDNEKKDNEMKPLVIYKHSEPVYDTSFYPLFKTNDYSTNLFLSCSRATPIKMFYTYQKDKICEYKYLFGDIVETAYSVTFNNNGQYILAGYKKYIIQFSTGSCGSEYYKKIKCVNSNNFGQKSIISCIKFMNNNNNIFGCGCYDGIAQLFDIRCTYALCGFKCITNKNNGINNILFSPCNNYILTGQRNTNDIYCWDLRYIKNNYYINKTFYNSEINFDKFNDGNTKVFKDNNNKNNLCSKYKRNIINNQNVQFDIDKYSGYWIVSGNQNNSCCNVYDVNTNEVNVEPKYTLKHNENVKSVCAAQICPMYPFLATAIGQRTLSKRRKIPKSDNNNNNKNKNNNNENNDIDSSESESDSDSDLECSNVNDICIWDLRFKQ